VRMVQLASVRERAPSARMFWDQAHDRWTFVAHHLPATGAGRTYQLWLITPADRKISAGTFTPRADGAALVRATYALARDSLAAVAVTEEPSGGVEQPTGDIVVAGRAER
ncbi:MAG TPA: anti-sigma factor, partial [Gemmatimonadaceae bacterium]|nr:anti-sigma factor [Gemmatimonadaceae bacterium]